MKRPATAVSSLQTSISGSNLTAPPHSYQIADVFVARRSRLPQPLDPYLPREMTRKPIIWPEDYSNVLIGPDSPLRRPPALIGRERLFLDGVRYAVAMADYAYYPTDPCAAEDHHVFGFRRL